MVVRNDTHAKLLTYDGRQALAFLSRNDDAALTIIVQLWCEVEDHQLRVAVAVDDADDAVVRSAFADLSDESVTLLLDELGVGSLLRDSAAGAGRG